MEKLPTIEVFNEKGDRMIVNAKDRHVFAEKGWFPEGERPKPKRKAAAPKKADDAEGED